MFNYKPPAAAAPAAAPATGFNFQAPGASSNALSFSQPQNAAQPTPAASATPSFSAPSTTAPSFSNQLTTPSFSQPTQSAPAIQSSSLERYMAESLEIQKNILTEIKNKKTEYTSAIEQDHEISCNRCAKEIRRHRYKCMFCVSYNLCEECEPLSEHIHDPSHFFIKIKFAIVFKNYVKNNPHIFAAY